MPLLFAYERDYELAVAMVVKRAAELRGQLDESLAARIANNLAG